MEDGRAIDVVEAIGLLSVYLGYHVWSSLESISEASCNAAGGNLDPIELHIIGASDPRQYSP